MEDFIPELLEATSVDYQCSAAENNDSVETPNILIFELIFNKYLYAQRSLLGQVSRVVQLIIVMPATNASSERSFSALC